VLERFKELWEWYWRAIGREDARNEPESSVFGWWLGSGAFDPEWALARMKEFVDTVPRPEPDHLIVEQLVKNAESHPYDCTYILQKMIEGDNEGWRVYGVREQAKPILEHAMKAGGRTRELAEQVIDALGRRGYVEFGELLKIEP